MAQDDRSGTLLPIGARIRQRRRELNLTQEALAERAGLSKSFMSEIEGGHTPASGLVYLRLAEELDVSIQWVLQGATPDVREGVALGVQSKIVDELANERGWSYAHTLEVAAAIQAVVGRRTRAGQRWEPTREYVLRVAEALEAVPEERKG
jgi:transcriptional regulator with XRE-family HTH domain